MINYYCEMTFSVFFIWFFFFPMVLYSIYKSKDYTWLWATCFLLQMNVVPTLSIVQGIVKEVVSDLIPEPIKMDKIIGEVARTYEVSENEILSRHKTADVAKARQVAMYIARETTELSYKAIGESFGRDHTTALFSVNKIEELIKNSPYDKGLIEDIIKNLKTES